MAVKKPKSMPGTKAKAALPRSPGLPRSAGARTKTPKMSAPTLGKTR